MNKMGRNRKNFADDYESDELLTCENCGEPMDEHPKQYGCGAVCHGCALLQISGITQADLDWITEELNSNVLW